MTTAAEAAAAPGPRRRPRDRKQQILLAARDLFVGRGFPNVSMALIAENVGITAGALYRHFSNKAVLLEEVVSASFGWLDEPLAGVAYEDAVEEAISRIMHRPYLSDLWAHEIRYLPDDRLRDLRRRMLAWNQSFMGPLHHRRPDLGSEQQELLAWSVQSVLSCLGRRAIHAPEATRLPAVRAALRALAGAELVPMGQRLGQVPRRLQPASVRERLLLAAFEQFGYRGYQDSSMSSIGAAADVTGPNLYSYFESKADLLRAVYDRGTHALWLALDEAMATAASPADALQRAVHSYIRLARTWASTIEDPTGELALDEAALAAQREYVGEWVALLARVAPRLSRRQARMKVHIALFLVSDLYRNPRVSRFQSFQANLASIVLAVLFDGRIPEAA